MWCVLNNLKGALLNLLLLVIQQLREQKSCSEGVEEDNGFCDRRVFKIKNSQRCLGECEFSSLMAKYELQKMEGNFLHKKLTRYCDTINVRVG